MSVLSEGTPIGVYRVTRLLGTGGMGAVYEAVRSDINRTVAIKVLHPQFAEKPEFKIRFTNEARIANVVDHPGLLQIADYGQLPDGSAYLVMEYLRGETLGTRIKRSGGILSPSEAVRLAHLVADSLEAAHSKGVIHREAYEKTMTCFRVSAKDAHRRRTSHGYSEAEDSSYSPLQLV